MISDRNTATGKSLTFAIVFSVALLLTDTKASYLQGVRTILSYALTPVAWVAAVPSKFFGRVDNFLENEPEIENAYEHLRVEYVKLKSDMLRRNAVEKENVYLRALLGVVERADVEMKIAQAVQIDLDPYQHRVLVNKGAASGVFVGQSVLDDLGIVGQVSQVFRSSSVVTLITDPAHTIPVRIQRNGKHILAEGSGDLSSLRIPFLNKNADIVKGDVLETSGLGGRFPGGFPVAQVDGVEAVDGEAFLSISASPVAAVESLNYLLFMSSMPEKDQGDNSVDQDAENILNDASSKQTN